MTRRYANWNATSSVHCQHYFHHWHGPAPCLQEAHTNVENTVQPERYPNNIQLKKTKYSRIMTTCTLHSTYKHHTLTWPYSGQLLSTHRKFYYCPVSNSLLLLLVSCLTQLSISASAALADQLNFGNVSIRHRALVLLYDFHSPDNQSDFSTILPPSPPVWPIFLLPTFNFPPCP